jgi:HTH-type transcriptional regulator, sugar sensing transcriptional regulator
MLACGFIVAMDDVLNKLKGLGLNSYEAKVYLALLKHHPVTGYEVSKESGVPQARAYDTLKSLEQQKIVTALGSKPTTYSPIPPEQLLTRWEKESQTNIGYLREHLPKVSEQTTEPVMNLQGESSIVQYAKEMIRHAKKSVFMELWAEDAHYLEPELRKAHDRGIDLKIVGYGDLGLDFCPVYSHGMSDMIKNQMGGRWMIIAADHNEGLAGSSAPKNGAPPHAVFTRNIDIVLIFKELVVHDIFLLEVQDSLREPLEAVYGKDLERLREKVLGSAKALCIH